MKKGLIVKIILGLLLIALLLFLGYKIVTSLTEIVLNMLNNPVVAVEDSEYGDYQFYTPEPMPTMPAYMGEDSFYDNAEDVIFEGE